MMLWAALAILGVPIWLILTDLLDVLQSPNIYYGVSFRTSHVICVADQYIQLPGPFAGTIVANNRTASSEQHKLPSISLSFDRRRDLDLMSVDSVRGWLQYYLQKKQGKVETEEFA
jgi:hypothetical protein